MGTALFAFADALLDGELLAHEKKRALLSLAIGAAIGLSYASWGYWNARKVDTLVQKLVQQCEQVRAKFKYSTYGEWEKAIRLDSRFQNSDASVPSELFEDGENMHICNPADLAYR